MLCRGKGRQTFSAFNSRVKVIVIQPSPLNGGLFVWSFRFLLAPVKLTSFDATLVLLLHESSAVRQSVQSDSEGVGVRVEVFWKMKRYSVELLSPSSGV